MLTVTTVRCLAAATILGGGAAATGAAPNVTATPARVPAPVATATPPAAAAPAGLVARVQRAYEGMRHYAAEFDQVTRLKGARAGAESGGRVWLQKPGRMRWEFERPEKKLFVSDGKSMWIYEPSENQVIVTESVASSTSMTALNFLEGLGSLERSFDVATAEPPAEAAGKDLAFLVLTPKPESDVQYSRILLGVDPKSALAREVHLVDALGNATRLVFRNATTAAKGPPDGFTFAIPPGAEVIRP